MSPPPEEGAEPGGDGVLIRAAGLERTYRPGTGVAVHALRGVDLTIRVGEHVAVVGASGSGKSTLLNLLGALDRPTAGTVHFRGHDLGTWSDRRLAQFRNQRIGFVFQRYHLLPRMSARDNVALPLVYRHMSVAERRRRAAEALAAVGLADRLGHAPNELSGGQQQRVAIARALVGRPDLLLADEPTGNLDTTTGARVMETLEALHGERGTALVVITHDPTVAERAPRRLTMRDGRIVGRERP